MGGTGSGRWTYHDKKRTVEECWTINIPEVARVIDLLNPDSTSGYLQPIDPSRGIRMSSVRCSLVMGDDDKRLFRLSYTVNGRWDLGHRVEQVVLLRTTRPHFGGLRWWFTCPHIADGERCGRRVGKLYRPPGQRHFACRHSLDLTYEGCQKSHRYDRLFALMAGEASGEAFETVKGAFSYQMKEARGRRAASSPTLLEAFERVFKGTDRSL